MLTAEGPKVLEFNCRLGDPEAECLLPRMESDLVPLMAAAARGALPSDAAVRWRREAAVTVVAASAGYPGPYEKGRPIHGLEEAAQVEDAIVFHGGTRRTPTGEIVTHGGRVVAVTALGPTLKEAARRCYAAVSRIGFEGMHYRKDIAGAAIAKLAADRAGAP
jgi:phosphoribosylamine--glycine ligase